MTDTRRALARLGLNVRKLRAERGLTQAALAERSNLSIQYVGEVERGRRNPTFSTLQRIARRGLGVSVALLLFEVDGAVAGARHLAALLAGRSAEEQERILRAVAVMLGE